jgi:Cytochrome c7 and related cytochrome c
MKLILAGLALAAGAGGGALGLLERLPPAPSQPLRFSHRVHAGLAGIACTFCHVYAERGPVAGIPSMARCRGCHKFIRQDPDDPAMDRELKALAATLEGGAAVEWVRVHRVPDHVFFTHQRHVRSGVVCRECHGAVETMEAVAQVAPLQMGWCLECHRRKQAEQPAARARLTECVTCHK